MPAAADLDHHLARPSLLLAAPPGSTSPDRLDGSERDRTGARVRFRLDNPCRNRRSPREAAISSETDTAGTSSPGQAVGAAGSGVDVWLGEDDVLVAARRRAAAAGATPVDASAGAALRLLASILRARHVVEIGTGCGVSGLYLLRGMVEDGVLTTVDADAECQRHARRTFADAGFSHTRARLITGRALDVLPRLSDGAYDLVLCDADQVEYGEYLGAARRLLRPGGVVVLNQPPADAAADPGAEPSQGLGALRDDPTATLAYLPVGAGLLVATLG